MKNNLLYEKVHRGGAAVDQIEWKVKDPLAKQDYEE